MDGNTGDWGAAKTRQRAGGWSYPGRAGGGGASAAEDEPVIGACPPIGYNLWQNRRADCKVAGSVRQRRHICARAHTWHSTQPRGRIVRSTVSAKREVATTPNDHVARLRWMVEHVLQEQSVQPSRNDGRRDLDGQHVSRGCRQVRQRRPNNFR